MKTTIRVTAQDIRHGIHISTTACPIALAARRAGCREVQCGNHGLVVGKRYAQLPPKAQSWIASFDAGKTVKPFEFSVELR